MTTTASRAPRVSPAPRASPATPSLARLEPRRFTVAEYYRMAEAGILGPDERTELLRGIIVRMTPPGPFHASIVKRLSNLFARLLGERAIVSVQDPLRADEESEPEPDVVIVKPRKDFYRTGHPRPQDVLLVIEVCDSSLAKDLKVKLPLYAEAGLPEVWFVELRGRRIAVCRGPVGGAYRDVRRLSGKASLSPLAFPDISFTVAQILGD